MYETYYYTNYPTAGYETGAAIGTVLLFIFLYILFIAIVYVVYALLLGQIFKKAGVPRWIAWVPFYNNWKMLELGNQQGFWAVLAIIPFINIASAVFMYIAMYHIGLKLGKSGAWVVLAIFLPIVWMAILALDSSKWDESKALA